MKTIFSVLIAILGWIIPSALTVSYFVGLVHSIKKHRVSDNFISGIIFPFGMYRGFESLWHKDNDALTDAEWDKKLKNDVYIMYSLMADAPKTSEIAEVNETIQLFGEKIKNYPKDKVEYLKEASKKYTRFILASVNDMKAYFKIVYHSKEDVLIDANWSTQCKPIMDSIINMYEMTEFIGSYKEMDSSMKELRINPWKLKAANEEALFAAAKKGLRQDIENQSRIYKMLFDEVLIVEGYKI